MFIIVFFAFIVAFYLFIITYLVFIVVLVFYSVIKEKIRFKTCWRSSVFWTLMCPDFTCDLKKVNILPLVSLRKKVITIIFQVHSPFFRVHSWFSSVHSRFSVFIVVLVFSSVIKEKMRCERCWRPSVFWKLICRDSTWWVK